jgi:hypothetical protein
VQANTFPEAVSALGACEKRRGEATARFFDDKPTVRDLATLPYWIGRAQEGLEMRAAAKAHDESFIARNRPDLTQERYGRRPESAPARMDRSDHGQHVQREE